MTRELRFPHSLGLLYSAFTYYCGFRVNSGEYKLMGLAPYGEPKYESVIRERLIDLKQDGSFRLNLAYFDYCHGWRMTSRKFHRLFGGPPRQAESAITQREMDLAASIQRVTEDVILRAAQQTYRETGMKNLCLAGGVALNCVANGCLLRKGPFERIWIQPAAGDAGGALGVALYVWHQLLGNERRGAPHDSMQGALLGPAFSDEQIREFLASSGAQHDYFEDEEQLCRHVAGLLESQKVVGWFQGRMEFGPRALGGRSILADARNPEMQSLLNRKIKYRESFRPFAPAVLRERACEFFQMAPGEESPYMLLVAPVAAEKRLPAEGRAATGLDRLKTLRSTVPAITHVDFSARVQTVAPEPNARFYKLLKAFETQTGCPLLINTSFNVRGEPIVCTPEQAYRCFMATNMDALVLGRFVLDKSQQTIAQRPPLNEYLADFALD